MYIFFIREKWGAHGNIGHWIRSGTVGGRTIMVIGTVEGEVWLILNTCCRCGKDLLLKIQDGHPPGN